ncbi:MAG TPA: hypothetical protein VJ953_10190 [Saprospiraceae bacterium]|nr:hypothetical protein [Saprospiraceae bacterium]
MGALANFQELARQEAIEFQLEQKLDRFEKERSGVILRNIQASYDFLKFVGDVSNLYFPVMLDVLMGISPEHSESDYYTSSSSNSEEEASRPPFNKDQTRDDNTGATDGPDMV